MVRRSAIFRSLPVVVALLLTGCGGSPTSPPPPPPPPPPASALPIIDAITVQGRRPRQPARFADLRETVDVSAVVRDAETPIDELVYQWSATAGTFSGAGRGVAWTAPDAATTPSTVTITLKVIENYGRPGEPKTFSQEVTGTQTLSLHDSRSEVEDYAIRFLTLFSQPQTNKNWPDIMRDFKAAACPVPGLVDSEKDEVIRHYTFFTMHTFNIQNATTRVSFGEGCSFRDRPGDACVSPPVMWDSTDSRDGTRAVARGIDHIAAVYSAADARWWLCSSDFEATSSIGHQSYGR